MSGTNKAPKYRLKVTAGGDYDPSAHKDVPVNEPQTLRIDNYHASTKLSVRIQNYTGYPDNAPSTNPYFNHPLHEKDQYSISFAISFKQPVNGNDLLFGNDFDRPIRDRLPPGFNAALRLAQWTIDPSLDGDAYADKPYLYSPGVATWNQFRVGGKVDGDGGNVPDVHDLVIEEGGEGDGLAVREGKGVPRTVQERRSHFQNEAKRKEWEFEAGRVYLADFGNQYLDFNEFTLRLPGFNINALHYIDEKTHSLRYVLKNRTTGEVYFVVLFTLVLLQDEENQEPSEKGQAGAATGTGKSKGSRFDWEEEPSAADVE
ncbi:hypothetical protein BJY01DRAFT_161022 [Aspergillus pseudoustus]|uniref:Domain of unknown function at the cortex 1 domain-containing protein n=1 Tax=Aspergillus pseudoustus TaxID=1810923 RepID=A0ABR4K8Q8_9EURO